MITQHFDQLIAKMIESELAQPNEVVGCSEAEIAEIESKFDVQLPLVYKEFLRRMGRCAGWFLEGTDVFYPSVLDCKRVAERLLVEDKADFVVKATWFVFLQHQGYQFMFFDTASGEDDPPVYHYLEDDGAPKKVADGFLQWLTACVEQESKLEQEIKGSRP